MRGARRPADHRAAAAERAPAGDDHESAGNDGEEHGELHRVDNRPELERSHAAAKATPANEI
jgi:hypothetical protein